MTIKKSFVYLVMAIFILISGQSLTANSAVLAAETSFLDEAFPDGLLDADQQEFPMAEIEGKIIGLYFSASWCRGCAAFSRILVPFHEKNREAFEVILVGFDNNSADMHAYMKEYGMNWAAIPYDSSARLAMKEKFNVTEIPQMFILTSSGRVLTLDGYKQVQVMGDEALGHWQKLAAAE
ncbi:MAG: hypothetical protein CVV42_04865 [Candidatus Riflebacteria bacterium HGW-Riflebacteria-2]|jgi:nucleoredoxin|nr:MAG: hypothetical protein CVV42_04865 [Candidatus Riflebacteria bacterium HGW-Riflebacteria-2]